MATTTETTTLNGTSQSNVHTISSPDHFREILSADLDRVSLLNFWAPWAEPCKQMNEVVLELAKKYPQIVVLQVSSRLV
jgi:thiol-disulfide isomerase/thioredoxin